MDELKLNLTELAEGTTYYYKAYATNSKGTSYGEDIKLYRTLPNIVIFQCFCFKHYTNQQASVV